MLDFFLQNHSIPVVNVPCLDYKLKLENINSQTVNGELKCNIFFDKK